jgi:hypothetical protein
VWHSSPDDPSPSVFVSKDGARFEGAFTDGALRHGATVKFRNGDLYTGQLRGLARSGVGTCVYAAGGATYEGMWASDMRHGEGEQRARSGDSYKGQWANDAPHGSGKCQRSNGTLEEGSFERGQLHGNGERRDSMGSVWRGWFVEGSLQVLQFSCDGGVWVGDVARFRHLYRSLRGRSHNGC